MYGHLDKVRIEGGEVIYPPEIRKQVEKIWDELFSVIDDIDAGECDIAIIGEVNRGEEIGRRIDKTLRQRINYDLPRVIDGVLIDQSILEDPRLTLPTIEPSGVYSDAVLNHDRSHFDPIAVIPPVNPKLFGISGPQVEIFREVASWTRMEDGEPKPMTVRYIGRSSLIQY